MADWVLLVDEATSSSYYANLSTRETSWRLPPELGGPLDEPLFVRLCACATTNSRAFSSLCSSHGASCALAGSAGGWLQYEHDETGRLYYYHKPTKRTTWIMPAEARPPPADLCDASADDFDLIEPADDEEAGGASADVAGDGLADAAATKAADKAAKRAARRLKILEEMLLSERTYVSALSTLRKVYLVPLRTVADQPSGRGQIFSHADLDAIFINIDLLIKVNENFLAELEAELALRRGDFALVSFGEIIKRAAKNFKGCYTRYVTNYDTAEACLTRLKETDKEKHRYLEVCKTHPDAAGLDVRSFLIQPVQRVPRYRMLLEDLLAHTDANHADEAPLRESLTRVCEVAMHINEEKRHLDDVEKMRALVSRFAGGGAALEKELVSYERRIVKEGVLAKVRNTKRQLRSIFLCNDVLLYAARPANPSRANMLVLKGKIWLRDGARIQQLPSTEATPHAFAVVAGGGKGYTWLAESAAECAEWVDAIVGTIDECAGKRRPERTLTMQERGALARLPPKTLGARMEVAHGGSLLTKYNQRDGKSSVRWVMLRDTRILWGDPRSKKIESVLHLAEAISLQHGAQSSAFFKQQGKKKDSDWQCFSIVFKERTLDFAADRPDVLLDWYLSLASLMPVSREPLLSELELRARIERMMAG